ncbi:hypothetical protein GCM10027521_35500 [Amycolatopsis cihanbeyliensis]
MSAWRPCTRTKPTRPTTSGVVTAPGLGFTGTEFNTYLHGTTLATALTITEPQRLLEPPSLAALRTTSTFRPPQSYRYLTNLDPAVLHHALASLTT